MGAHSYELGSGVHIGTELGPNGQMTTWKLSGQPEYNSPGQPIGEKIGKVLGVLIGSWETKSMSVLYL